MRIAITGGTGFVGGHLAEALSRCGQEAVAVSRGVDSRPWARHVLRLPGVTLVPASIQDQEGLVRAFAGCDGVAHCAGINREIGTQTYDAVHVRGTANVVQAAEKAGAHESGRRLQRWPTNTRPGRVVVARGTATPFVSDSPAHQAGRY